MPKQTKNRRRKIPKGTTKVEKGRRYILNIKSRWERADKDLHKSLAVSGVAGVAGGQIGSKLNPYMFKGVYRDIFRGAERVRKRYGATAGGVAAGAVSGYLTTPIDEQDKVKRGNVSPYSISKKRLVHGALGGLVGGATGYASTKLTDPRTYQALKAKARNTESYDRWMATLGKSEKYYYKSQEYLSKLKNMKYNYEAGGNINPKKYSKAYKKYAKYTHKFKRYKPSAERRIFGFVTGRIPR